MPTEYYYVRDPSDDDISNSVHGTDSPSTKQDGVETYLLSYTNGYIPPDGIFEYHADAAAKFENAEKDSTNKQPDAFALVNLVPRCNQLIENYWLSLSLASDDRVTLYKYVSAGLDLLRIGDISAARYELNDLATTTEYTAGMKTSLIADIDAILADYTHLQ